ncbi:CARDB domain-containing protein [Humisphaera borealis]|uniref:CARDB domain-containing protein n=1 Tax=Humisphaera borealis TaxID=2807512 RepID=A0A7M2X2G2_9BACT|nr:CARDB domain-containing protein [Humisphaera borealis]QOV91799.1 hypothetical protein IPV69_10770 [Humisphaera borealis]
MTHATKAAFESLEGRKLFAAAGDLDAAFGTGGRATINFPVVTQPANSDFADRGVELFSLDSRNGLTVVAGDHRTGSLEAGPTFDDRELALARLDASGQLDPTFDGDGVLYSPVLRSVVDIYVQSDNGILVLGSTVAAPEGSFLARFTPAGTLDTAFGGGDGIVAFDFTATNVDQTPEGKIVVSGSAFSQAQSQDVLVAARLLSEGALDASFDDDGVAETPFAFGSGAFLAIQPNNGKVLLATSVVRQPTPVEIDGSLIRLNLNGNPDSTFSGNGQAFVNSEQIDDVAGIDVGTTGDIFVALGDTRPTKTVLTKVSSGGSQGLLFEALDANALINDIQAAFDTSGKVLLFGRVEATPGASDFKDAVIRYNGDGTLDRTFGTSGKGYIFNEGETGESANAFLGDLQADMRIVSARGDLAASGSYSVTITRRLSTGDVPPVSPPTSPPPTSPPTSPPPVSPPPVSPPTSPPPTSPPPVSPPPPVGATQGTLSGTLTTKLPAGLIGQQKLVGGKVIVAVTNPTTSLVKGKTTFSLSVSADATLDSGDAAVVSRQQNLKLKPGQTRNVKLPVKLLPIGTAGTYQLLARITAPDQTTTDVAGGTTFSVAEPVVDLSSAIDRGITGTVAVGAKAAVKMSVQNLGNVPAKGPLTAAIFASTDNTSSSDDVLLVSKSGNVAIKPGKSKSFGLSFRVPANLPAGTYYLTAKADTLSAFAEPDEANNIVVSSGTFTVG